MPLITSLQQTFNGGQMAPFLHSRADIDKYRAGLRDSLNFIPTPFGPLRRRPGFIYGFNQKSNSTKARVITFALGSDDGYVIELGAGYMRFIRNRLQLTDAGTAWADGTTYTAGVVVTNGGNHYVCLETHVSEAGATVGVDDGSGDNEPGVGTDSATYWHLLTTVTIPAGGSGFSSGYSSGFGGPTSDQGLYELPTPFGEDDLYDIVIAQVNDVMYLVHKDYPVQTLSRFGDTQWDLAEISWAWPPMRSANIDTSHTMAASAVTGTVTITSSEDFFTSAMVGGHLQITHKRPAADYTVRKDLSAAVAATSAIKVRGEVQFRTNGVWTSTIDIESSDTGAFAGEEVVERQFVGDQDENFIVTLDLGPSFKYVRINHTAGTTGSGKRYASLEAVDATVSGWVEITGYTSATQVTASVGATLYDTTATDIWNEGAFSDLRGHARTVTLHELRLVFGGTDTDRQTVWASQTDDFPNFETGTLDTDSFRYQIASTDHNTINWLESQKQLLIGTSGGEWVLDSGRDENVITPTNRRARRHSNFGSEYRQALTVDSSTLFVRSGAERLADFSYLFEEDGYSSADLNLLSYDLTRGGILQTVYQKKRDPFLWTVVDGESLAVVSYNRKQSVTGWTPVTSPGDSGTDVIESVTTVGRPGDEDEVWVTVKRTINSFTVRYIERLDSDAFDKQEDATHFDEKDGTTADAGTNLADLVFLDSAYSATGTDLTAGSTTTTVAGLDHLVGAEVVAYADGARVGDTHTVNGSGEITIDGTGYTKVTCGLRYTSRARTLPLFNAFETGTTRGREAALKKAVFILHRTGALSYAAYDDPGGLVELPLRSSDVPEGDPTPLRSGEFEVGLEDRYSLDPSILIETDEPSPLTLECLILKYEVNGT